MKRERNQSIFNRSNYIVKYNYTYIISVYIYIYTPIIIGAYCYIQVYKTELLYPLN